MEFHTAIDIDAPPGLVWEIMRDVERWPEWTPTVTSLRRLDSGPLAVGSRALIRQPKLPPARWAVTELDDAARSFTWVTRSPGVLVTARHWVEEAGTGSRANLSLRFSGIFGPLVGRLTRNLNERYLALEADGLRRRAQNARK